VREAQLRKQGADAAGSWCIRLLLVGSLVGHATLVSAQTARAEGANHSWSLSASGTELERIKTTTLGQVLRSAERHVLPQMTQTFEVEQAKARALGARGAFDLKLATEAARDIHGKYAQQRGKVALKQMAPFAGLELELGYRYGDDHPVYAGKSDTSKYGEAFGRATLPFLKDSSIDAQRLRRGNANIGVELALADAAKQRLDLLLDAGLAYYDWVKSYRYVGVERLLVELAQGRARLVRSSVSAGQLPRIELLENERLIAERREQLLTLRATAEQAEQQLAFFYRSPDGRPKTPDGVPPEHRTPSDVLPPLQQALLVAEENHPYFRAVDKKRVQLERALAWSRNQRLPDLDFSARVSKDFGPARAYAPFATTANATEVFLELQMAWPVQQSKARGKELEAAAKLRQLQAGRSLFLDQLATEIAAIDKRLELARERLGAARTAEKAALALATAERDKFEEGQGTIFMINQREKVAASASKRVIQVEYDYATLWLKRLYLLGTLNSDEEQETGQGSGELQDPR
jgi:outer membrane protein TolC